MLRSELSGCDTAGQVPKLTSCPLHHLVQLKLTASFAGLHRLRHRRIWMDGANMETEEHTSTFPCHLLADLTRHSRPVPVRMPRLVSKLLARRAGLEP